MTKKTTECYMAIFNLIEKSVFKLEPSGIMTDFEAGLRSALRTCYPKAILRGCWYHYCAAVRKKMFKIGLHRELETNADARMLKQLVMSLPLLPSENQKRIRAY